MLQSGIKENDLISKIKDVYRWASLISDLDVQIYKDLDKFSPVKITGELIFQRVLNAGVDNCKTWFDTAQCYLCDKHSICTIEMDELKEVLDNEFCEIMQLTNMIN